MLILIKIHLNSIFINKVVVCLWVGQTKSGIPDSFLLNPSLTQKIAKLESGGAKILVVNYFFDVREVTEKHLILSIFNSSSQTFFINIF